MPEISTSEIFGGPEKQAKERDQRKSNYSAHIKYYHQRLIEEGYPETYIMNWDDVARAITFAGAKAMDKNSVKGHIRNTYGTADSQALLAGLDLPNSYKETY